MKALQAQEKTSLLPNSVKTKLLMLVPVALDTVQVLDTVTATDTVMVLDTLKVVLDTALAA